MIQLVPNQVREERRQMVPNLCLRSIREVERTQPFLNGYSFDILNKHILPVRQDPILVVIAIPLDGCRGAV
jgi:hypothetical protein